MLLLAISFGLFKVLSKDKDTNDNLNDTEIKDNVLDKDNELTDEDNNEQNDGVFSYEYDADTNQLIFYKGDTIIKELDYNELHLEKTFGMEKSGKYILYGKWSSYDDASKNCYDKVVFYDLNNDTYKEFKNIRYVLTITDDSTSEYSLKYIGLANVEDEYAIIDLDGNYIKEFSNKEFVTKSYEGAYLDEYSYSDNLMVTIVDGKYGLEKISNDDIIVEHKFEDLIINDNDVYNNYKLYSNKYIKVKEDGKWYLYDLNNKKKVTSSGYDKLYLLDENVILVYEDKYFYFKDYNNNLLTNDRIYVENIFPFWPKMPEGIKIVNNNGIYTIIINDGTSYDDYKYYSYEFNLDTKELTNNNS